MIDCRSFTLSPGFPLHLPPEGVMSVPDKDYQPVQVRAHDLGHLAVTESIDVETLDGHVLWAVTHKATGALISPRDIAFSTPRKAFTYARRIGQLSLPWECSIIPAMARHIHRNRWFMMHAAAQAGGFACAELPPDMARFAPLMPLQQVRWLGEGPGAANDA